MEPTAESDAPYVCPCHGLSNVLAWRCQYGGVHTKGVHHQGDTPLLPAERVAGEWCVIPPGSGDTDAL